MFTLAALLKAKMDGGYDAALDSRISFFLHRDVEGEEEETLQYRADLQEIKKGEKLRTRGGDQF